MKINDIFSGRQNGNKKAGQQEDSAGVNFKDLLKNQAPSISENFKVSGAGRISRNVPVSANLRLEGLVLTEKTIDTLESFGTALGDSRLAADDLEPFIAALEEDTGALLKLQEELPKDDPLAILLNRVATITYLETAKYRRGDYEA